MIINLVGFIALCMSIIIILTSSSISATREKRGNPVNERLSEGGVEKK